MTNPSTALREKKLNVKDLYEEGLEGRPDEDVPMAFAWDTQCVLLTHDRDFLDDRKFPANRNPGVIVLLGGSGDHRMPWVTRIPPIDYITTSSTVKLALPLIRGTQDQRNVTPHFAAVEASFRLMKTAI